MYIRYILILIVNFYVSRIVLDKLGVNDFGLYNVVFSVIGVLTFVTGTLSSCTSRFISFALGKNNRDEMETTFKTSLATHLVLCLIIIVIGETIGLWYIMNILVVPEDRYFAVMVVYQISILLTVISVAQVPFTAVIMAHEHLDAYAYIGIFDAFARLVSAYLLSLGHFDNLIFYAILLLLVVLTVFCLYLGYCLHKYPEVNLSYGYENKILISMLKFSGWNILTNFSQTIMIQGVIMLFNLFFSPVVAAAQAISNQISSGIWSLAANVQSAVNPQIIKLYADNKHDESKWLTYTMAEMLFYLMMVFCIPCIVITPFLLHLWLVEVPEYTVLFVRLIMIQLIFESFNNSFYTPLLAANRISANSCISLILCIFQFIVLYCLFHNGYDPVWARYFGILLTFLGGCVVKPLILSKWCGYDLTKIFRCLSKCLFCLACTILPIWYLYSILLHSSIIDNLILFCLSLFIVVCCVLPFLGKKNLCRIHHFITLKK